MPGRFKIEWRIKESVEAVSREWRHLNDFYKLKEMQDAFDQLNKTGQLEFRQVLPEESKPKEENKQSFFNNNTDEKSTGTGNADHNNRTSESISEKESQHGGQLPLL